MTPWSHSSSSLVCAFSVSYPSVKPLNWATSKCSSVSIVCPPAHSLALILQSAMHKHTAVFLVSPPDTSQRHLTPNMPSPAPPQASLSSVFHFSQIAPLCTGCHPGELPHTFHTSLQIDLLSISHPSVSSS